MSQLEIVHIYKCLVDVDFYDLILKHCKNLKAIYVHYSNVGFNWLLQEYPKLEHLYLTPGPRHSQIEKFREFFVRNPNVRTFSTDTVLLWDNRNIFLNSNIKLDIIELQSAYSEPCSSYGKQTLETHLEFLNQLHEQGFYKRLHIFGIGNWKLDTKLALIKGLELLSIGNFREVYNLDQLTNLRELMVSNPNVKDMETLANSLTNLDRLFIYDGDNIDVVLPFIRRSLKLNKIKFLSTYRRRRRTVPLNLAMLNEERAELFGARKITIYVSHNVFLATKWTTRNGDTNLSSIEVRRSSSIKWNPDYFDNYESNE